MERYERIEKNACGKGTYGVVYKGVDKTTGLFVALKKIKLNPDDEGIPSTTLREISVLRQLRHPNIVELSDVVQNDGRLYLVFEFVDRDLKKYLDSVDSNLPPNIIQSFTHQMSEALDYIHKRGIIHRDMKPQNVLVSSEGCLKIADFGLARAFVPPIRPFTHEVVTLWYRAPEILLGCKTYALPVDMWSLGCIVAEMVTRRPLFPGDSEIDEIYKIFRYHIRYIASKQKLYILLCCRVFGTPGEETWPGVTAMEDWSGSFPIWPTLELGLFVPGLSESGVHLLEV